MIVSQAILDVIKRFNLGLGDLKSSPDYEEEMVLKEASKELSREDFNVLTELFSGKKSDPVIRKPILHVETGVIKPAAEWAKSNNGNKIFYRMFNAGNDEFKWNDQTFRKLGEW